MNTKNNKISITISTLLLSCTPVSYSIPTPHLTLREVELKQTGSAYWSNRFDAVCISKAKEGRLICATQIERLERGPCLEPCNPPFSGSGPESILGQPEPEFNKQCRLLRDFFSILDQDGYISVSFGEDIEVEPGDKIAVYVYAGEEPIDPCPLSEYLVTLIDAEGVRHEVCEPEGSSMCEIPFPSPAKEEEVAPAEGPVTRIELENLDGNMAKLGGVCLIRGTDGVESACASRLEGLEPGPCLEPCGEPYGGDLKYLLEGPDRTPNRVCALQEEYFGLRRQGASVTLGFEPGVRAEPGDKIKIYAYLGSDDLSLCTPAYYGVTLIDPDGTRTKLCDGVGYEFCPVPER